MKDYKTIKLNIPFIMLAAMLTVLISAAGSFGLSVPYASGKINSADGAVLRRSASADSAEITLLPDDTEVIIIKEVFKKKSGTSAKNRWYCVAAGDMKGYVRSDLVDTVNYGSVSGTVTGSVYCRRGAGTGMKKVAKLQKNSMVNVVLSAKPLPAYKGSSSKWYKIEAGGNYFYVCSKKVSLSDNISPPQTAEAETPSDAAKTGTIVAPGSQAGGNLSDEDFEKYLRDQGFPEQYKVRLMELHRLHPNWGFAAYNTNISWSDAVSRQTRNGVSLVHSSFGSKYRSGSRQIEPGWYNANSATVAYFMDPRNFLTEDRIMMFEDLTYKPAYQTAAVVATILAPSKLPEKGFTANIFIDAGAKNNVSPVFLAARARQEVGGGSDAINGVSILGEKVYNPFNIGAFGGTNPLYNGLLFARAKGWNTQAKSVEGGAAELSKYYINKGQHTIYYQRFNVRNGAGSAGTHQYMTNIHAPFNESYNTKESYARYGILNQPLVFEIPVYLNMPNETKLP